MSSIVETTYGKLEGQLEGKTHTFKGVPYAKPPVGKLRFQAPEPPEKWSGVREAKEWGNCAPQIKIPMQVVGDIDEDCLYLNVYTPGLDGKKRPVMYWIHGGGFMMGTGGGEMYQGNSLCERGDVVVVTINYRLGALGFTHFGDLLGDSHPTGTNLGMQDQAAGLEWVRDNIEAFGGDPDNVTIFGESAGGMSVGTLLGMPRAKGLFHKAIPQSGATNHVTVPEDAVKVAAVLLKELGIDKSNPEKLWELPFKAIFEAQQACATTSIKNGPKGLPAMGMVFIPVVDGDIIPEQPQTALLNGYAKDVAIMVGHTLEEGKLFTALGKLIPKGTEIPNNFKRFMELDKMDDPQIIELSEKLIPGHAADAVKAYRSAVAGGSDVKPAEIFNMVMTDMMFRIPAVRLAEASAKHQPNTYMYRLDWQSPMPGFGACHAIDLPFLFSWTDHNVGKMFTGGGDAAKKMSEIMQDSWISFAREGKPTSESLPKWPSYNTDTRSTMVFNKECKVQDNPFPEQLKFWDDIV